MKDGRRRRRSSSNFSSGETLNQKKYSSDFRLFFVLAGCCFLLLYFECVWLEFPFSYHKTMFYYILFFSQPFFGIRCKNHIKTTCYNVCGFFCCSFFARFFFLLSFFGFASVAFNYGSE